MSGAMIRGALVAALTIALILAVAAPPAAAQTATSGDVGSAALRNGYPAGGGAVALPAQPAGRSALPGADFTLLGILKKR